MTNEYRLLNKKVKEMKGKIKYREVFGNQMFFGVLKDLSYKKGI
jgi:hypothetical protein